ATRQVYYWHHQHERRQCAGRHVVGDNDQRPFLEASRKSRRLTDRRRGTVLRQHRWRRRINRTWRSKHQSLRSVSDRRVHAAGDDPGASLPQNHRARGRYDGVAPSRQERPAAIRPGVLRAGEGRPVRRGVGVRGRPRLRRRCQWCPTGPDGVQVLAGGASADARNQLPPSLKVPTSPEIWAAASESALAAAAMLATFMIWSLLEASKCDLVRGYV